MLQTNLNEKQDPQIFSIDPAEVARLNNLFWAEDSKRNNIALFSRVGSAAVGLTFVGSASSVLAQTAPGGGGGGTGGAADAASAAAAQSIATGVTNSINMITAVNGIGGAAFGVALAPLGFMLTLRILNMVLSRV
jgi:hypothetical protein